MQPLGLDQAPLMSQIHRGKDARLGRLGQQRRARDDLARQFIRTFTRSLNLLSLILTLVRIHHRTRIARKRPQRLMQEEATWRISGLPPPN